MTSGWPNERVARLNKKGDKGWKVRDKGADKGKGADKCAAKGITSSM